MDNADRCYECKGYGDDYYIDEDGELVSACSDCPFNEPPENKQWKNGFNVKNVDK